MDSSVFQLFDVDEVLERLCVKRCTGCFHIFTATESANIFFKDGLVVAAGCGAVEGEEVLTQIMGWNGVRYHWQPDVVSTSLALKPLQVNIEGLLARHKQQNARNGKTRTEPLRRPAGVTSSSSLISIPSKGPSTGPLPNGTAIKAPQLIERNSALVSSGGLSATKTIAQTPEARAALDEELLQKYKMVLVSAEDPKQRLKVSRVSNLIGRNPACDITIAHASISRQHCLLQLTDRGLHIKDLDTTNGTKINGIVMKEGYINAGDKLTIGHLNFSLEKA